MKTGYIYKITNTTNGKIYIGKTVQEPNRRWYYHKYMAKKGGGSALYNALRKYGEESFTFEVIESGVNSEEINIKEESYITLFNCCALDPEGHGYNLTRGGDGGSSELSSQLQLEKVERGEHHFQGEAGRKLQLDRIQNGTHNFTPENLKLYQSKVVKDKEKLSKASTEYNRERVANGTHPWQGGEHMKKLLESGLHPACITYTCPHCGVSGKGGAMQRWHFDKCKNKEKQIGAGT